MKIDAQAMLAELESPTAGDNGNALLIRTLAEMDAVLLPLRSFDGNTPRNRHHARKELGRTGLPFRMNAMNDGARKASERDLVDLENRRFIRITRLRSNKFPCVRLTPKGEATARALAGLPGRPVARLILEKVASLTDREPMTFDRLWLDEVALNGGRGWGDDFHEELSQVELDFLPAASLGWLDCGSTCFGHVRYCVTRTGWSELDRPSKAPRVELPDEDEELRQLYRKAQDASLSALSQNQPTHGEIGPLPLPVAHRGVAIHHDQPAVKQVAEVPAAP